MKQARIAKISGRQTLLTVKKFCGSQAPLAPVQTQEALLADVIKPINRAITKIPTFK